VCGSRSRLSALSPKSPPLHRACFMFRRPPPRLQVRDHDHQQLSVLPVPALLPVLHVDGRGGVVPIFRIACRSVPSLKLCIRYPAGAKSQCWGESLLFAWVCRPEAGAKALSRKREGNFVPVVAAPRESGEISRKFRGKARHRKCHTSALLVDAAADFGCSELARRGDGGNHPPPTTPPPVATFGRREAGRGQEPPDSALAWV